MVIIKRAETHFIFKLKGIHKLWTLTNKILIPIDHVVKAYPNQNRLSLLNGIRMPGTYIPGLIIAGTYLVNEGKVFYDLTRGKRSIVVQLKEEKYKKLIIDVKDVPGALDLLNPFVVSFPNEGM